jgi:GNAT superfamily N-acetyltransferase
VPSGSVSDLGNAVLGGQVGSLRPGCPGGGVDAGIGRGGPVDSRAVQAFDVAGYVVDDDAERVDVAAVWQFLSTQAYWGRWRRREDVAAQVRSAWRVVGVYRCDSGALVGFARAVSDGVSLAYLADVFITPGHRGRGLGKLLVAVMIDRGAGAGFHWLLHTADAHSMYAGFGFAPPNATLMERPGDRRTATPSGPARPVAPPDRVSIAFAGHLHTLGRGRFSAGAGRLAALGKAILLRNKVEP